MSIKFTVIEKFTKSVIISIASFFSTKAVLKLLLIVTFCIALVSFIRWLPALQVKQSSIPVRIAPVPMQSLGEIPNDNGITFVTANGGKTMHIDPAIGNIIITDDKSGLVWKSFRTEDDLIPEDMSFLRLSFISQDNSITNWSSWNFSQRDGNFTVQLIPNGVRLNIQIANADPTEINAFMPRRIAIDRYEKTFLRGIDAKVDQNVITQAEANMYRSVLGMIYGLNQERGFYFNQLHGSLPLSAVRQMLALVRLLGYTVEQLIDDEAPYDLPVEDRRPPVGFIIPVDLVLDNGDLVVSVSTENIEVQNEFYTLTRLSLLPNFGSVSAEESNGGYIFVPDGSGALFAMNSFDPNYNGYERPLYWNTVFRDMDFMPQFPEDLHMPVYGMIYDKGGFLAIIEKGDETGFIGARSASFSPGAGGDMFNTVYSVFDVSQFKQVNIVGAAEHGGTYTVSTGMLGMDIIVRYRLFSEKISYFDMAKVYKNYLIDKFNLKPDYNISPQIFLDVTGALTIEGRFLGIAYEKTVSMTGYSDLTDILRDLQDIPLTISYNGVFNGGINNKLSNRAALISHNGTASELRALLETADKTGADLFMGTNIARIYKDSKNGFNERIHAAYRYEGTPAKFKSYDPSTRLTREHSQLYYRLNPLYLANVLDGFLKNSKRFNKIYINDLGTDYYANYRRTSIVPPLAASQIAVQALERLDNERIIAINNPGMNNIPYTQWAVNISRESSNYGGFYTSIPFRQLVMNGLLCYTTLNANNSGESMDYFLLQALELGSVPKFWITSKSADVLKYTSHTEFLSTQYSVHKENIETLYQSWNDAFDIIKTMEIANHETLEDRVFRTTYKSGVTVIVNYNRFAVETDEGQIGPRDFIIRENIN